mmetsp:Transcript_35939/g.86866  ORF Transcript_35939/g.86866 Transcript_35939/m.86866 type:complete len:137 (+) Transcript_35939:2048-2458(+)
MALSTTIVVKVTMLMRLTVTMRLAVTTTVCLMQSTNVLLPSRWTGIDSARNSNDDRSIRPVKAKRMILVKHIIELNTCSALHIDKESDRHIEEAASKMLAESSDSVFGSDCPQKSDEIPSYVVTVVSSVRARKRQK